MASTLGCYLVTNYSAETTKCKFIEIFLYLVFTLFLNSRQARVGDW